MRIPRTAIQTFASCAVLLLVSGASYGQKQLTKVVDASDVSDSTLPASTKEVQVRVRLVDGSTISVDEAWESQQGVWYRRGGMSHLVPRERVKTIERGSNSKAKSDLQVSRIVVSNATQSGSYDQPVWIYLIGGARVEADSATESAAGVWYRRGPLSIFVERARVDHIEREELETLAESDPSSRKARGWTTGSQKIDQLIKQSGAKYDVDPYLIFCVMEQESHFNARALSPKGARGLMQLMPGTSVRMGVKRPSDPAQNIAGGTRYLKQLIQQFNGRIDLVLASYNAGEGAVMKFGRKVPPYRETREYVKRISYRYHRPKPVAPARSDSTAVGGEL